MSFSVESVRVTTWREGISVDATHRLARHFRTFAVRQLRDGFPQRLEE